VTTGERHCRRFGWSLPAELRGVHRALAVVAHPDDESFGLGAVLSSLVDWGIAVDLLCFSRGEASTVGASDDLGRVRAKELSEAAKVLGLGQVWLEDLADGELDGHQEEMSARLAKRTEGADALVVFEPSGVTGHCDHRAATAAAHDAADRLGVVCIEWGVAPAVAAALSDELGAPLLGLEGPDVSEWHVDRERQDAAIIRHESQAPGNPLLTRRLALQGGTEQVRVRSAPFGVRLARLTARMGPLLRPEGGAADLQDALDLLIGFAAGGAWPADLAVVGDEPGGSVHLLHRDQLGWSLMAVVVGASPGCRVRTGHGWAAAATIDGVHCAVELRGEQAVRAGPSGMVIVDRGSAYVIAQGETWQLATVDGSPGAALVLMVDGEEGSQDDEGVLVCCP